LGVNDVEQLFASCPRTTLSMHRNGGKGSAQRDEPGRCRWYVSMSIDRRRLILSVIVSEFITFDRHRRAR
jgi:hypothetical protein